MGKVVKRILMLVLLGAFVFCGMTILVVRHQYTEGDRLYEDLASQYTLRARPRTEADQVEAGGSMLHLNQYAPITVDFEALKAKNDEVVGWIYCEDSVINYPVMQTNEDYTYLYRAYDRTTSVFGSIFVEAENSPGFQDYNTIIYGHHMQNDAMFGSFYYWADQDYYDSHPVMWLLTPERDYKIVLFSGYTTSAYSDTFSYFREPGESLDAYLQMALEQSEFRAPVELDPQAHYVLLSTCSYVFASARTVLHGMLVPADSAGGVPLEG